MLILFAIIDFVIIFELQLLANITTKLIFS